MPNLLDISLSPKTSRSLKLGFYLGIVLGVTYFLIGSKLQSLSIPVLGAVLIGISIFYGAYSKSWVNIFLCLIAGIGGFFVGITGILTAYLGFIIAKAIITGK